MAKKEKNHECTEYRIIRSKRKTAMLVVKSDGKVEVRVPNGVADAEIKRILSDKAEWITKHREQISIRRAKKEAFRLKPGDRIRLMDERFPIKKGKCPAFEKGIFWVSSETLIKEQVIQIYRVLARKILCEKIAYWEPIVGVKATGFRINGAKTRWGSCSGKNSLNFSWRLIMAPEAAVDYVVVHELCHILEHNHSKGFWKQVERVLPDYRQRQACLKAFSESLAMENWD